MRPLVKDFSRCFVQEDENNFIYLVQQKDKKLYLRLEIEQVENQQINIHSYITDLETEKPVLFSMDEINYIISWLLITSSKQLLNIHRDISRNKLNEVKRGISGED